MKSLSLIEEKIVATLPDCQFDSLAVAHIDFKKKDYQKVINTPFGIEENIYFDLASLTKPLTLASYYLSNNQIFKEEWIWLLNHQAGLPDWGRLSKKSWREQINSYKVKNSPTLYSDFSFLRLMLELENFTKLELKEYCIKNFWDKEIYFWKDLPRWTLSPITGHRMGKPIQGQVHDDNAFVINSFCSHAGLFGTIDGVSRTLLNLDQKFNLLKQMEENLKKAEQKSRFVAGWDRVVDLTSTLAGNKASLLTFGHLGFTGTSIWIDCITKKGCVILSNGVQKYWYQKEKLNQLRREIANLIWTN